jgi:hypothetical protein
MFEELKECSVKKDLLGDFFACRVQQISLSCIRLAHFMPDLVKIWRLVDTSG